jgi:hypothetical protein
MDKRLLQFCIGSSGKTHPPRSPSARDRGHPRRGWETRWDRGHPPPFAWLTTNIGTGATRQHFDPGICRVVGLVAGDHIAVRDRERAVHVRREPPRLQIGDRSTEQKARTGFHLRSRHLVPVDRHRHNHLASDACSSPDGRIDRHGSFLEDWNCRNRRGWRSLAKRRYRQENPKHDLIPRPHSFPLCAATLRPARP